MPRMANFHLPSEVQRPRLGAHMSIAGGYWRAVEAAAAAGCDCVQLFTKNNNQWRGKPITEEDARQFREALERLEIVDPLSHASYLINLASPDELLRRKSCDALVDELRRAHQLGIPQVVVHPGAYQPGVKMPSRTVASPRRDAPSHTPQQADRSEIEADLERQRGLERVGASLRDVLRESADLPTLILLENTAGQGSVLGHRFAELRRLIEFTDGNSRLGVCIDTCHAFAAGYDWRTECGYESIVTELEQTVTLAAIRAVHLNDSKKILGSRVDRHEHIGLGQIGDVGFCRLLNDARWSHLAMYLETEKGEADGEPWDVINLRRLRSCFQP